MAETNEKQIHEWHEEGVKVVSEYKRCEHRMVYLLAKMSERRGYLLFKSESLRQYAVCVWGLPEHAAKDLVTIANKSIEIPALLEALEGRRTTVSKLRKICPVIDTNNYKEWIELTMECSARMVEKAVAMEKPETEIYDQIKYRSGNRVEMKAGLSEYVMHKLRRVQDLLSQKLKRPATFEEALEAGFDQFIERNDPIKKAERVLAREVKKAAKAKKAAQAQQAADAGTSVDTRTSMDITKTSPQEVEKTSVPSSEERTQERAEGRTAAPEPAASGGAAKQNKGVTCRLGDDRTVKTPSKWKKFAAATLHTVNLRDGGQCTEINPDGERCPNRRWLDRHHIVPRSEGGTDEPENLTTLCSGHHRAHHFAEMRGGGT